MSATLLTHYLSLPALHRACFEGNVMKVQSLIAAGHDVNEVASDRSWRSFHTRRTPLLSSVMGGHPDIMRILISQGADVNMAPDAYTALPLRLALSQRQWQCAIVLIESGADISIATNGSHPIIEGAINDAVVQALFSAGMMPDSLVYEDETVLDRVLWNALGPDRLSARARMLKDLGIDFSGLSTQPSRYRLGVTQLLASLIKSGDIETIRYVCASIGKRRVSLHEKRELLILTSQLPPHVRDEVESLLNATLMQSP
jgi:hypothetical protein